MKSGSEPKNTRAVAHRNGRTSALPRLTAVVMAVLMLVPTALPGVTAEHTDPADLPEPHDFEVDEDKCFAVELPPGMVAGLTDTFRERDWEPFWAWMEHEGRYLPALCLGSNGGSLDRDEYAAAVESANEAVRVLREFVGFSEDQFNYRREAYTPQNRTPVLYDTFDDNPKARPRIGGYGEWDVVSVNDDHEDTFYRESVPDEFDKPRGVYRFANPEADHYPSLAQTALVSPLLDLETVDLGPGSREGEFCSRGVEACFHGVNEPRDLWEQLRTAAGDRESLTGSVYQNVYDFTEGMLEASGFFGYWENRGSVTMDIRHRYNLAEGTDGVRVEVWDYKPTPEDLRDAARFGSKKENPTNGVEGVHVVEPLAIPSEEPDESVERADRFSQVWTPGPQGSRSFVPYGEDGVAESNDQALVGWDQLRSKREDSRSTTEYEDVAAFNRGEETGRGFTGYEEDFETATFDLSRFVGKQVYVVVQAKTSFALGDYFEDESKFETDEPYGYFLDEVNVTATMKMRNLRVFDVAEPDLPLVNPDTGEEERTILPPAIGEEVAVYVTNAGRYEENATVSVTLSCESSCGRYSDETFQVAEAEKRLKPGEVWPVTFTWPGNLVAWEGQLWKLSVEGNLPDDFHFRQPRQDDVTVDEPTGPEYVGNVSVSDGLAKWDPWQPRNESYYGTADYSEEEFLLRVVKERRIEAVPLEGGTVVDITPRVAERDDPREIRVRVQNTGNTVESVRVAPTIVDDTRQFNDFFTSERVRDLGVLRPGESRVLTWDVSPYEQGTFRFVVDFVDASDPAGHVLGSAPSRPLYVERTAGVVCDDDLHMRRACAPGWELDRPAALQAAGLNDLWRAPNGDLWAVGAYGNVYRHTSAEGWMNLSDSDDPRILAPFPGDETLHAVHGYGTDEGYVTFVVGDEGAAYRFDGAWTRLDIDVSDSDPAASASLRDVWAGNATHVFAVGSDALILELNRTTRDVLQRPAHPPEEQSLDVSLLAVDGTGPTTAWAVGERGHVVTWDGAEWNVSRKASAAHLDLRTIRAFPSGDILVGGEGGLILNRSIDVTEGTEYWTTLRDGVIGAPGVTGFAGHPESGMWALGERGTLLECTSCPEALDGWDRATPIAPFLDKESSRARLVNGTARDVAAPSDEDIRFDVVYQDPDGKRPNAVHVILEAKDQNPPANKEIVRFPVNMTYQRGSFRDGALYSAHVSLDDLDVAEEDKFWRDEVYNYTFVAESVFPTRTPQPDQVRVSWGGDCGTGGVAPATAAAAREWNATISPPMSCAGTIGESETQAYSFQVTPGQQFNVTLNNKQRDMEIEVLSEQGSEGTVTVADEADDDAEQTTVTFEVGPDAGTHWALLVKGPGDLGTDATRQFDFTVAVADPDAPGAIPFPLPYAEQVSPPPAALGVRSMANARAVVDDGTLGGALALVEGGYLYRFHHDPLSGNTGDWDPDFHLRPTGDTGEAWYAGGFARSVLRFSTEDPSFPATDWRDLDLTVRHALWNVGGHAKRDAPPGVDIDYFPEIRLVFTVEPEARNSATMSLTCASAHNQSATVDVCEEKRVVTLEAFGETTPGGDWFTQTFDLADALANQQQYMHPEFSLAAVEFYVPASDNQKLPANWTQWAVDEVSVHGTTSAGADETLIHWWGEDLVGTSETQLKQMNVGTSQSTWQLSERPLFDYRSLSTDRTGDVKGSLWYRSDRAEKPVWVANDQETRTLRKSMGLERGVDGQTSWLTTPVMDLRETTSPVFEFRHGFQGRVGIDQNANCIKVVDSGRVKMQLWHDGQWTGWHTVAPVGGYPGSGVGGLAEDMAACESTNEKGPFFEYGDGFYYQTHPLDAGGTAAPLLDLANLEPVRIDLMAETLDLELPDPTEGKVRFAFAFDSNRDALNINNVATPKHGGWYVTDFRLFADETLGHDLSVDDLEPDVGFEWEEIGFGPSTVRDTITVPFSVNVTNSGRFPVNGFEVTLHAVKVEDRVERLTRTFQADRVRYDQVIEPGETRSFGLSWNVPPDAEGTNWTFKAVVTPLDGADEDDVNNVATLATVRDPVPIERHEDVRVRVDADPRADAADVRRYVPVIVENHGNVPARDLIVKRKIYEDRSAGRELIDAREWTTSRTLPEGETMLITSLTGSADVLRELYWMPPSQGTYVVRALLDDGSGRIVRNEMDVAAFTTYLFDDFEDRPQGSAFHGDWTTDGDGWSLEEGGGFAGSDHAWRFGDPSSGKYPQDADASLETPLVDLTYANNPRLLFYHKYDLEEGYDAGVVEASLDGGETWKQLTPEPAPRFGLSKGYPDVDINAASPLNPTNDSWNPTRGFTGDSRDLPGNVDGWTLSQVDLVQLRDLVKTTTYAEMKADALSTSAVQACPFETTEEARDACLEDPYYADPTWLTGDRSKKEYWELHNLMEGAVEARDPSTGLLWSGTANTDDDGETLDYIPVLELEVDLTNFDPASDERIELRFWDWMRRDNQKLLTKSSETVVGDRETGLGPTAEVSGILGPKTYRANWSVSASGDGLFTVLEEDGRWWRWAADVSDHKGEVARLRFIYDPFKGISWTDLENGIPGPTDAGLADPGWAIDDIEVAVTRGVGEEKRDVGVLYTMEDVDDIATAYYCHKHNANVPCIQKDTKTFETFVETCDNVLGDDGSPGLCDQLPESYNVTNADRKGRGWALLREGDPTKGHTTATVPHAPANWTTIGLETHTNYFQNFQDAERGKTRATGEETRLFWSGDLESTDTPGKNVRGGQDYRLVTPAIDLGRVAGEEARLEFDHLYSFFFRQDGTLSPGDNALGDIGVLEVQAFDRVRNEWGEWEQLYDHTEPERTVDGGGKGYPRAAPVSMENLQADRLPAWFKHPLDTRVDEDGVERVYGFMGASTAHPDYEGGVPWIEESFDLSPYLGKEVRFSFHLATAVAGESSRNSAGDPAMVDNADPDRDPCLNEQTPIMSWDCFDGRGPGQGGWFLDNIRIVGDAFTGDPVSFRFRATADGSHSEGHWAVDDVSISGLTYRENLGVFVTEEPEGAMPGTFAYLNGTLENLAESVRRNLVVEVREATLREDGSPPGVPLELVPQAVGDGQSYVDPSPFDTRAARTDITLVPGATTDFSFKVKIPEGAEGTKDRRLLVRVAEENPAATDDPERPVFTRILSNDVDGFLSHETFLTIESEPDTKIHAPQASPARVDVGEPVRVTVPFENRAFVPATLEAGCEARRVIEWERTDHRNGADDVAVYGPAIPCDVLSDEVTVQSAGEDALEFAFTPDAPGFWHVSLKDIALTDHEGRAAQAPDAEDIGIARVLVGREPVLLNRTFASKAESDDWTLQWKNNRSFELDDSRTYTGEFSLRAGLADDDFSDSSTNSYGEDEPTRFTAVSEPVDLHNLTPDQDYYLRFKHLPRFAFGDGADVRAEIRLDERFGSGGWTFTDNLLSQCRLTPEGGYDGPVWSYLARNPMMYPQSRYAPDENAAFMRYNGVIGSQDGGGGGATPIFGPYWKGPEGVYASDGSNWDEYRLTQSNIERLETMGGGPERGTYFTGFHDAWQSATFNLKGIECPTMTDDNGTPTAYEPLLGSTVRFHFTLYTGKADAPLGVETCGDRDDSGNQRRCDDHAPEGLKRGRGQGWFVDDVRISGYGLNFSAPDQTFNLRDNGTKRFPTLLGNPSPFGDEVSVELERRGSNIPEDAVDVWTEKEALDAGENTTAWAEVRIDRDPGLLPIMYNMRLRAESAADASVQETRDLTLNFGPHQWPDLSVTMEPPSGSVQEGTRTYLPITIENQGLVESPAPAIVLVEERGNASRTCIVSEGDYEGRLENDEGCTPLEQVRRAPRPIPSYTDDPVESTVMQQYLWTPMPGTGERKLTVIVDPIEEIEQYSRSNDRYTIDLNVTRLLQPDLVFEDEGITIRSKGREIHPDASSGDVRHWMVEENEVLTFEARVRNDGPVGATNVDVRAFIGSQALPPQTVEFIPAGSEVVVPFTWVAQQGEWFLQFDTRTELVELDDRNNRVPAEGAMILTVKGFEVGANLQVPERVLEPGETVRMNVTLTNDGATAEDVRLRAIAPDGWDASFPVDSAYLRRGEVGDDARVVPLDVTVGEQAVAGEQVITVQAVARENSMKTAVGTGTVTVRAMHGAELSSAAHETAPGTVKLPVRVANTGNSPEPFRVDADLPDGWTLADEEPVFKVRPFSVAKETLLIRTPTDASVGAYPVTVKVTLPDGSVEEAKTTVHVQAWRQIAFEPVSEEPTGRDALTFEVEATNVGNLQAPFTVLTPDLAQGWHVDVAPPGATLAPGESMTFSLHVTPPEGADLGRWRIPLRAHFDGVQPASVEGRANLVDLPLMLVQPDVVVDEFEVRPGFDIQRTDRVQVRAPVVNLGNADVTDVTVALFVDDVLIDSVRVDALASDGSETVSFNWTAVGGEHVITVVADPFQDIAELTRDNNAGSRVVVVEGPQESVQGVPAQTVETPGLAPLGLVAVALALAVWRRPRRLTR